MTKTKHIITILVAFLFICFTGSAEKAYADQNQYKVGTSSLNVRVEPSINADVIGSLPNGTSVQVLDVKYDWAKIHYGGGIGWIASYFLTQSTSEGITSDGATSVTVAADGVRLRSGPGTDFSILGFAANGDTYPLIEESGQWKHVRLHNGKTAWIANWLVSSTANAAPQTNTKNTINKTGTLAGQTIILDAGHGGYDPGAIGIGNIFEKELTLSTAHLVKEKLKNAGAEVIMTRSADQYVHVNERVDLSRAFPSGVFISIHYNAHESAAAKGVSTYYYHPSDRGLSTEIQQQLAAQTGLQNDGVQFGDFYVLRNNNRHSLLLELGFITNLHDYNKIQTQNYQHQVANSITQGLINYFN